MGKTTKILLIVAAVFVLGGMGMVAAATTKIKSGLNDLNTVTYETNTYEISENFNNLSIDTSTADIVFSVSADETCKVVCFENSKVKHSVTVEDNTLVIKVIDERTWRDHIGMNFDTPKVTVFLPKTEYDSLLIEESTGDIQVPKELHFKNVTIEVSTGDVQFLASVSGLLNVETSTGYISVENGSVGDLDLNTSTGHITVTNVVCKGDAKTDVSTGKVYLTDLECKNLTSIGNTGDITLTRVIAAEKISLKRSTGDVRFEGADASEIKVVTDTGDVTGTLLSEKIFFATSDTGSVEVPKSTTGGKCEVTTDTGNVKLGVQ